MGTGKHGSVVDEATKHLLVMSEDLRDRSRELERQNTLSTAHFGAAVKESEKAVAAANDLLSRLKDEAAEIRAELDKVL